MDENPKVEILKSELFLLNQQIIFQNKLRDQLFDYLCSIRESRFKLKSLYSELDRKLAKLDGRHKFCDDPSEIEKQRRKNLVNDPKRLLDSLTKQQKQALALELIKEV